MFPIAYAQGHITAAKTALGKLESAIIFPLMVLMMSVAFLMFLWGVFEYILNAADSGARETGKRHMLYGIIGLFVMVCALAILKLAAATFAVPV